MSPRAVRTTLAGALLLALLSLALLWVDGRGRLRHVHWQPPQAIAFDASRLSVSLPQRTVEQRQLLQTLERPLFSPSRRPPPPPPPAAAVDAQAGALADVHLYGLYGVGGAGGAIVRIDGKDQRLAVNESVKGWKLVRIGDNGITLRRGAQERTIELVHVIPASDKSAAAAAVVRKAPPRAPMAAVAPAPTPSGAAPVQPDAAPVPAAPAVTAPATPRAAASPPRYSGPQSFPAKPANTR